MCGIEPDRLGVVRDGAVGHSQRLEHVAASGEAVRVGRIDRDGLVVGTEGGLIVAQPVIGLAQALVRGRAARCSIASFAGGSIAGSLS